MIVYETWLNGRRLCTAGMPGYGVLSMGMTWVKRDPAKRRKGWPKKDYEAEEHTLDAGGLFRKEHVRWVHREVKPGDVLRVRILRKAVADVPDPRFTRPAWDPTPLENLKSEASMHEWNLARLRREIRRMEKAQRRTPKR